MNANDDGSDNGDVDMKHVHLDAFGRKLRLKLKDNADFNERTKDMKVYIAETSKNGGLKYREDPSASVLLFVVVLKSCHTCMPHRIQHTSEPLTTMTPTWRPYSWTTIPMANWKWSASWCTVFVSPLC